VENLHLPQDFKSLQSGKQVSGLLPVQSVIPQYVCIEVLQHKGERIFFFSELMPVIES